MIEIKQVELNARETFVDFAAVFSGALIRRFSCSDMVKKLTNVKIETHFKTTQYQI